jgi:predicted NUDIX family NTP pyrophosphohydrolase
VDRAEWFDLETARRKILPAQATFLERLEAVVAGGGR